jgi:DNA-binding response OmpR family regulator
MAKILLVEPAENMGKLLKNALSGNGYQVSWHRDAQSAVHSADRSTPDAVVLELAMPRHNGMEFLHEFRSYTEWVDVPVIIHSMVAPDRTATGQRLMRSLGVVEHLYKPTTKLKKLLRTTEEALA